MDKNEIRTLNILKNQLQNNFEPLTEEEKKRLLQAYEESYEKLLRMIGKINLKNYNKFSPLHSGQYGILLYLIAHNLFLKHSQNELSDKIYMLNKMINGLDLYYAVKLPELFLWEHPVGTVLGKAQYGNRFFIYQNCTVGGNVDKEGILNYPIISDDVTMYSYSVIIGKSKIGKNCIISSGTYIKDEIIPDNSIVFGRSPNLIIKTNNRNNNIFRDE